MLRRETEISHSRMKHDKEKMKKQSDIQAAEFSRKNAEFESRSSRQQGEFRCHFKCRTIRMIRKKNSSL